MDPPDTLEKPNYPLGPFRSLKNSQGPFNILKILQDPSKAIKILMNTLEPL